MQFRRQPWSGGPMRFAVIRGRIFTASPRSAWARGIVAATPRPSGPRPLADCLGGSPSVARFWKPFVVSDISNNAGSCQDLFYEFLFSLFFFRAHYLLHSEEW